MRHKNCVIIKNRSSDTIEARVWSGHLPFSTMQSYMKYKKKYYLRKEEMKGRREREQCKNELAYDAAIAAVITLVILALAHLHFVA